MLKIIRKNLGVYFMTLACLDFALLGACAKILSENLSSIQIMFFRNLIGSIVLMYLILKIKNKKEGGHFLLLLFRGIAGTLALYAFFYNIANISLGGAFAFQKTAPIFISIIAFFIFKEKLNIKSYFGILIAFFGVLLICEPWSYEGFDFKNTLLGIFSGLLAAMALTSVRELKKSYNTEIIAFSFVFLATIFPLFSMIIGEFYNNKKLDFIISPFIMPDLKAWIFIFIMGIFGTLYQIHITKAYGVAKKAAIVAGVSYLDVIFSLFLGILLGDKFPNIIVIFGMMSIIFGGIILLKNKEKK